MLVGGVAWGLVTLLDRPLKAHGNERWSRRDYANLPEVKLLQEYVRIDTSESTGDEVEGAQFLARQFAAAGIPHRIERLGPKKANLYAWLDGKDPPSAGAPQPHRRLGRRSQGVVLAAVRGADR